MLKLSSKLLLPILLVPMLTLTACSDSNNDGPIIELLERYVLSSPDSIPEGVAFDPVERAFYATSLQGGSITKISADGSETIFRAADNRARLVGAKVDSDNRRLWVCAQEVDDMDNRVWVFDLASAELVMEFLLGALSTNGTCNDLVLDASGNAYVTDPSNPFIYTLDAATETGSVLATDPLFTDFTGRGLGLNGIALSPDGSALIVAKFVPAGLIRVSLPAADDIRQLNLTGDDVLPPPPDGLVELNGDIYAVSHAAVTKIILNSDATAGEFTQAPQITGLSTATIAEGALYAIKSEVTSFVVEAPLELPFEIFRVDLESFNQTADE
jgi:sugar lactone lactonase YvrE